MDDRVKAMIASAKRRSSLLQDANPLNQILGCVETFEEGCGNTIGGKPEDCPECVRAFVDAVKRILASPPQDREHG
jgi:hypothetical protein